MAVRQARAVATTHDSQRSALYEQTSSKQPSVKTEQVESGLKGTCPGESGLKYFSKYSIICKPAQ